MGVGVGGGFTGGYKKQQQQNRFQPYPSTNHRTLLILPGKLVRICPHGSHLGAGEGPVDAAGKVNPEEAPALLRKPHIINDNYCITVSVPVAQLVACVKSVAKQDFCVTVQPH